MDKPFYEFQIEDQAQTFQFVSVGKRLITKCIAYRKTTIPNFYNLAMGDVGADGILDVDVISDNGDRDRILATVIQTLLRFSGEYPSAFVLFAGSSPTRTRLYQIGISRELEHGVTLLNFWGMDESGNLSIFEKNKSYIGFVVSLKANPKRL